MRGRRSRGLSETDRLLVVPFVKALDAIVKVCGITDKKTLERYAKLYNPQKPASVVREFLAQELGIDVPHYPSEVTKSSPYLDNGPNYVNLAHPAHRVSLAVTSTALRQLVTRHGYTQQQISELRGDDIFHVTPDGGVFYKILG